jgi:uncharacterized damage-inducible protein DinB
VHAGILVFIRGINEYPFIARHGKEENGVTQKEILLEQLSACQEKNGWFVSMSTALRGLTAAQACVSPGGDAHSVWQILNHVIFWNERYLMRFRDEKLPRAENNELTFMGEGTGDEAEWKLAVERFDSVMKDWQKAIRDADEAKLAGPVKSDSDTSWHSAIASMAIHTAHHIGQIVTLRKVLGTWDSAQGVS